MPEEIFNHGGGGGGGAAKVSLNGNTSGTLTLISTGTLYLGGGANITLSQDGNSITISGGVNTGATTFLAGVQNLGNTSGATGTVNNQIIFAGGNNITLSESKNANSATVTISGPNVFSGGVSTGGNTVGTTGTVSNQILFVGSNNITLRQSSAAGGATITISGPTLGAAQTGISSVSVSDTVYTSGGISFVGSNAATVKSGAGQQVIIDVPVQTAQPEGTIQFGASNLGNTLGTTGMASGTGPRLVFVGGNNITLSQSLDAANSSGTITISGANLGGAQTGISSVSVSDTVYTSGGISFVGSNNVTVKSGPGQQIIIDATGGGGAFTGGVSSGGNTAGTTGTVSNGILFLGGSNVTLSQSSGVGGATITVNAVQATGFVNSISAGGNTAGDVSYGTGKLALMGGNNITLSGSTAAGGMTLTISGPNAGGAQTGISGISASDTVYSSGTVKFTGSNIITVKSGTGQAVIFDATVPAQTVESQTIGMSNLGNTSGTSGVASGGQVRFLFAGGNNITLSQSIDGASGTVTISAGASGAGYTAGLSTGGNTSGDATNVTGRLILAGGNNITLSGSTNAGSMTITISAPSGGGAGMSNLGNTAGTSGTVDYQLVFVGGSNISLSQSVNGSSGTVTINGGAGGAFAAGVSSGGNTSGDTKTVGSQVVFVGGSNITLNQATNGGSATITIVGASGGGAGFTAGASTIGNTLGSTGPVTGQLVLAGINNITLSQSVVGGNATLSISGPSGGGAGMGTGANTSGTSGTVGKELYVYGGANISLSQSVNGSSASLSIIGAAAGTGGQTGISSISVSDTVYTSGQVQFVGSGNVTVRSGTGQAVIIDVSAGTGAGYIAGLSNIGNTSGDATNVTGRLILAGGNNVTLSGSTNAGSMTITISAANAGGAQTGISSISVSDTVYTSGQVKFTGSNNITVLSGTGQQVIISGPTGGGAGMGTGTNTSGTSGTVGRELFFYGNSNIGLSQSTNGSSASLTIIGNAGGGAFSGGDSNIGNTLGETGVVSNRLVLAGGNNITLSGATNASGLTLTISGPNVGGAQTGISGVSVSDTVYTSGTIKITGSNNITVVSGTGQNIIISGPSGGGAGMSNIGNTSGTTGTVGAQLVFAGGNNITLSQSVNGNSATLTISGPNIGGAQTGISAIVDGGGNSITAGTVIFANSNGVSFGFNSNTMTASVSQSVQPEGQDTIGMSNLGNTSGTSGVVNGSNLQFYFAGGNNITLSQSINGSSATLTISGPNVGGAQTGISSISVSDTVYTSGQVKFTGSNNITVLSGTGQAIIISGPTGGGAGMSNVGNTSGTTGTVGAQLVFAGGNNITLSQSVNGNSATLTISGANVGGAQTGISSVSVSDTVYTSGQIVITGAGAVTVSSGANQSVIINAPVQSNQNVVFYATSNTTVSSAGTINASSIILKGNDKLSVGVSNGSLIFEAGGGDAFTGSQVIGMSNLSNTSGTSGVVSGSAIRYYLAGGNNVTLNQSLDGVSGTVTISAISVPSTSSYAANISNVSSAGTKSSYYALADHAHIGVAGLNASGTATTWVGNVMLSGTNITLVTGGNSSAGSIGFSAGSIPASSAYAANVSNVSSAGSKTGNFALADHAHIGVGGIVPNGTASTFVGYMNLSAGNNMSLASGGNSSAGSLQFVNVLSSSAIAQPVSNVSSAGTQASRFALADHAHQGLAGIVASGTASTFVGSLVISVSNLTLVTGGNSTAGSIGISAAAPGAGGGAAVGMGATGNTAGNTFSSSSGTVYIQGTNNITVSGSTAAGSLNTIWVSGPTGGGAGMGTGTNTSGTSGTVGKELYFYGNSNIGISQSTNGSSGSLTIIGLAGAGGASVSEWMPPGVGYSSFTQQGQSSLVMFPVAPPYYVSASQANLWASISVSTSSNSSHNGYISLDVGVYTKNASTLSLASSGSTVHSWNITGSTSSGSVVGWRALSVPINLNMTPGLYWVGVISRTATTNANFFTASNMALIPVAAAYSGPLGATNNTNQMLLGMGVWSAQSAALPASVAFSHITATSASTARPMINFINQTV